MVAEDLHRVVTALSAERREDLRALAARRARAARWVWVVLPVLAWGCWAAGVYSVVRFWPALESRVGGSVMWAFAVMGVQHGVGVALALVVGGRLRGAWFDRRVAELASRRACGACGYSLAGQPPVGAGLAVACPECGASRRVD